eukprot:scaffold100151_cov20-Tisochrysis_lutea.AAC.1
MVLYCIATAPHSARQEHAEKRSVLLVTCTHLETSLQQKHTSASFSEYDRCDQRGLQGKTYAVLVMLNHRYCIFTVLKQ